MMLVKGGTSTGKSTVINYINFSHDNDKLLRMGTTRTSAVFIGEIKLHLILYLPINRPFKQLIGVKLIHFKHQLCGLKIQIIEELSMLVHKMLYLVYQ